MKIITCVAPVNIAVIKYWGKRDEELILPVNDSISGSLSTQVMCAKTTIRASESFKDNRFWLNGVEQPLDNPRFVNCLRLIKQRSNPDLPHLQWNIHISSENNFPTAAGLASSAAGYACLVYALANLYNVTMELSDIARRGSGSACRSIYGGWVRWYKGILPSGEDSIAKPIAPSDHWPEMRVIILVVNEERKPYSSTTAMRATKKTSTLFKNRINEHVPPRVDAMEEAILTKNFAKFGELSMRDSNEMHACCLDTYPPCVYMNDTSRAISAMVHAYNDYKKGVKAAYTFDAGPNACIYLLDQEVADFVAVVNRVFPHTNQSKEYFRGLQLPTIGTIEGMNIIPYEADKLKYIIYTKIGEGPQVVDDHLMEPN